MKSLVSLRGQPQLSNFDHPLARGYVRFCTKPCCSTHAAASYFANKLSRSHRKHQHGVYLRPLPQCTVLASAQQESYQEVHASAQQESYQEVHEYIVLFKVTCHELVALLLQL